MWRACPSCRCQAIVPRTYQQCTKPARFQVGTARLCRQHTAKAKRVGRIAGVRMRVVDGATI